MSRGLVPTHTHTQIYTNIHTGKAVYVKRSGPYIYM